MSSNNSIGHGSAYENVLKKPIKFKKRIDRTPFLNNNDMTANILNKLTKTTSVFQTPQNSTSLECLDALGVQSTNEISAGTYNNSGFYNEKLDNGTSKCLTKAELMHRRAQRENIKSKIQGRAALTHRQKVSEFNERLSSLPEHFDIPKVGPG